ncbi:MAG: C69 family dipeptidase, partial [Alistipes sp.]|nr:C69 family dipeptidase [Alistipes sp.]
MKKIFCSLMLAAATLFGGSEALACTNFIITRGASTDGSILVTYAADSHQLYGCLYKHNATKYKAGTMLPVTEWDTGKSLGLIPQVAQTYSTVSNMNEHS